MKRVLLWLAGCAVVLGSCVEKPTIQDVGTVRIATSRETTASAPASQTASTAVVSNAAGTVAVSAPKTVAQEYQAGDPWPLRIVASGISLTQIVTLGVLLICIRWLGRSSPDKA